MHEMASNSLKCGGEDPQTPFLMSPPLIPNASDAPDTAVYCTVCVGVYSLGFLHSVDNGVVDIVMRGVVQAQAD